MSSRRMAEFSMKGNTNSSHAAIHSRNSDELSGININDGLGSNRCCSSIKQGWKAYTQKWAKDEQSLSACIFQQNGCCDPQKDCKRSNAMDELLGKGSSCKKLRMRARSFARSCDGFDYCTSSSWISNDRRLDKSTEAYYSKKRKLSSSLRKDSHLYCCEYDDHHCGNNVSIDNNSCPRNSRVTRCTCPRKDTNAAVAGDCCLLQDFVKEDEDQAKISLLNSRGLKLGNESLKCDVVNIEHVVSGASTEHSLLFGIEENEQPHPLSSHPSPLYEHLIPQDGSAKKVWQASKMLMPHGAPKNEILILDSSEEESIVGSKQDNNTCLNGQTIELKKYNDKKENSEGKFDKDPGIMLEYHSNKFEEESMMSSEQDINTPFQGQSSDLKKYDGKKENSEEKFDKDQKIKLGFHNNKFETCFEGTNLRNRIETDFTIHSGKDETTDKGFCNSEIVIRSFPERSTTSTGVTSGIESQTHIDTLHLRAMGIEPRVKKMINKYKLPLVSLEERAIKEPPIIVPKAILFNTIATEPHMWDMGVQCDLCQEGPSLLMGEWYSWCCGLRLSCCTCRLALKLRLKSMISSKKTSKLKKNDDISWSGVVHKMCGLWSSEVYEEGEGLQDLFKAVKRGRSLKCSACRGHGATLGCRVKACRRSFHYPCADELASKLCCRMWDGVQFPIACQGHRHVSDSCVTAKRKVPDHNRSIIKGFVPMEKMDMVPKELNPGSSREMEPTISRHASFHSESIKAKNEAFKTRNEQMIETSSETEHSCQNLEISVDDTLNQQRRAPVRRQLFKQTLFCMGRNVLCKDISSGYEAVLIPCTNDIDSDPAPSIHYIKKNRYCGEARQLLQSVLLDESNLARVCEGCDLNAIDNPQKAPFIHVGLKPSQRVCSSRFDWQGQLMMGRLSYDKYGRLLLGSETRDIVECNSRCPCEDSCLNRELQRGIRIPLEIFKTSDRGWGVRTMEQIPRGKFVLEYVGEVLTQGDADKRQSKSYQSNMSVECDENCPNVPMEDFVIDHLYMSNVSRFINHSCAGNLRIYRVYTEIAGFRFFRIGLYALRDIEMGEELCYDYADRICKAYVTNDQIKCLCGVASCRGSV